MYKYCLRLDCEKRQYILASKEEEDLQQWLIAIAAQIDQVQQRVQLQRVNAAILEKETQKSVMDRTLVVRLIKSSTVMLDALQKSILIGYFTNRDVYLNKLIPLLSVFMDQSNQCKKQLEEIHRKPRDQWQQTEVQAL